MKEEQIKSEILEIMFIYNETLDKYSFINKSNKTPAHIKQLVNLSIYNLSQDKILLEGVLAMSEECRLEQIPDIEYHLSETRKEIEYYKKHAQAGLNIVYSQV
jgi:hypothetical protein